jgi:hypothetical protein
MNTKILAVIVAALVTSGAGVGFYYGAQTGLQETVNANYVSDPSSSPIPQTVTDTTINAYNSTIIADENSTIIYNNQTVSPTQPVNPTIPPTATPTPRVTITYTEIARNDSERFLYYTPNDLSSGYIYCTTVTFNLTVTSQGNVQYPVSHLKLSAIDGKGIPNQKITCSVDVIDFNNPPAEPITLKIAINCNTAEFYEIYGVGYKLVSSWSLTYPVDLIPA